MNQLENALNTKRKEWYGDLWDKVDWYGIPNRGLPQNIREEITELLKKKNK